MSEHAPLTAQADPALWRLANRRLLAKLLSEFAYEGLIAPVETAPGTFALSLDGVRYDWRGRLNLWGQPLIAAGTLHREADGQREPAWDAMQAFAELAPSLPAPALTLAQYASEMQQTLLADLQLLRARAGLDAAALLALPDDRLNSLLDGHPKAIPNKGRVGWGIEEHHGYGTESARPFRLHWLAVARGVAPLHLADGLDEAALLAESCDEAERARLLARLADFGADAASHWLLPVHPWQWHQHIAAQYAGLLADGRLIHLGEFGDRYTPQPSLRTLSNHDRPAAAHLKLPLTVLNTSSYRGLPGKYLAIGPALSRWLSAAVAADPALADSRVLVLEEPAGGHVPHPFYAGLAGAPYHLNEMLGAVWRDSPAALLADGERAPMFAMLQQCDDQGRPLAAELIRRSGLAPRDWLTRLFDRCVLPLYHLQCRYGLGFIAHGQNLTLILRDAQPVGVALKDFQGDLFLADLPLPELDGMPAAVRAALPTMPPHYLIHNLWTALFGSVFRFMAGLLEDAGLFDETAFWRLLAERLRGYQAAHPELADRYARFDPFTPEMPRLSLNRARFVAGYGDSAERPVHAMGPALINPLAAHAAPAPRKEIA
ncbi:IucA/IucC family protein [Chromobacterium sp. CV08]|uniref:IucA/IucC family protein n=1 Tax=Chromobacterium sp. CV08 TaxID=3133274 RepID=UPI003DA85512